MYHPDLPDCYVFLGPTLPLENAKQILAAKYLPPIKCGDLFKLWRLKPKIVLIIDGVFEQEASVWHKEILFLISEGVVVYGCSSMGALRAAELNSYGMIGIGKIFEQYNNGDITDDGEVAVSLLPSHPFTALTIPLVNIRESLEQALHNRVITQDEYQKIFDRYKLTHYSDRLLETFPNHIQYIDQKALDAEKALRYLANLSDITAKPDAFEYPNTLFTHTLQQRCDCSPFIEHHEWLPEGEKIALASRLLPAYRDLKTLAILIATMENLENEGSSKTGNELIYQLLDKYSMLYANIDQIIPQISIDIEILKQTLLQVLRVKGKYKEGMSAQTLEQLISSWKTTDIQNLALFWTSLLWSEIKQPYLDSSIHLNNQTIADYSNKLRRILKLENRNDFLQWLENNTLDQQAYIDLVIFFFEFDYFILRGNLDQARNKPPQSKNYLHLAIKLCKGEVEIKHMLSSPKKLKNLADNIRIQHKDDRHRYRELDFLNQYDFQRYLTQLQKI